MGSKFPRVTFTVAIVATATLIAGAMPAAARDWHRAMERHYEAAEAAKFTPRGDNPQWDFDLETMVNDMEWRERTARMLRNLPKPSLDPQPERSGQLADRPATRPLRFRF